MKKNPPAEFLLVALCFLLLLSGAAAETRQGVIALEGMEEPIEETLFESQQGFSFWYASDRLEADSGAADGAEGAVVVNPLSDDRMALSIITEEEAARLARASRVNMPDPSDESRVQTELYCKPEGGMISFCTLISENGRFLRAAGKYSLEAAEGTARFFERVLDSVALVSEYDLQMLKELPGKWIFSNPTGGPSEGEEARASDLATLTLGEDGKASLSCYSTGGEYRYTCEGAWSYESAPDSGSRLTLLFTSTDNPSHAESGYRLECVYASYTESWLENDTLTTCLILNPMISCSGVSPFEELYGESDAALYRKREPNMRVAGCDRFVSLREKRSSSSKRLAKVPLGAAVLAFPEYGEDNGFVYCAYQGEYGYILSDYLRPAE